MWEWLWWTGPDHVQPAHHRGAVRLRLLHRAADRVHRHRDPGLDPLPPIPADPRGARGPTRPRALLHEAEVRRPRGDHPQAQLGSPTRSQRRRRADPAGRERRPCRSRSAASASAIGDRTVRPAPSGSSGQVIHSDGRGMISELAFARGARIEPHSNPNTTWFVVIEGGGWVGGRRGAHPGRGRRGGAVAGRRPACRLDRALRDAGVRRRVHGADDSEIAASSTRKGARRAGGAGSIERGEGAAGRAPIPTRPATSLRAANRPEPETNAGLTAARAAIRPAPPPVT